MHNLIKRIQTKALVSPDKYAFISESHRITYQELIRLISNGCSKLAHIDRDQTIGIMISSEIDHLIVTLCLFQMGINQTSIPTFESEEVQSKICDSLEVKTIICLSNKTGLFKNNIFWPQIDELRKSTATIFNIDESRCGCIYIPTSGSTGKPNIISLSENQISLQATRHPEYEDENLLRLASVEYNTSKRHRLYTLHQGGTNIFKCHSDSLTKTIDFALSEKVSCIDISRMHISDLLSISILRPNFLKNIKLRPGGAAVPFSLRQKLICNVTDKLYVRYATTETGAISMAHPNEHFEGACGKPLNGIEIEIIDEQKNLIEGHPTGTIRIKAPGMTTSYVNQSQEYINQRFRDGWFYPGDVGYLTDENNLVILGRKDTMINLNGINIYPLEIEHVLESHPKVASSVAFKVPSKVHGEIPLAAIVLKKEAIDKKNVSLDILNYCKARLGLKSPRKIFILESIPKKTNGKVDYTQLLALQKIASTQ